MKKSFLILTVASMLFLLGCSEKATVQPEDKTFTFKQYQALYAQSATDLKFDGFTKVKDDTHFGGTIVYVDKPVTFGTREELTDSGAHNDPKAHSTQSRTVYQNKKEGYVLYVDFIYLRHNLDNDLVSLDTGPTQDMKDIAALNQFKQTQLSYQNTL
ncbi:MAG: hypothetical protein ACXVP2_08705, partial [Tumebacillaceae bacterium]